MQSRIYLKLFLGSCEPYLRILGEWLKSGKLSDHHLEFFVKQNSQEIHLDDKLNWNDNYEIQIG